jgi:hypothetical protein
MRRNILIKNKISFIDHRYTAGFHSNSYIKHLPFQLLDNTGRFKIEIWFLSESSSGKKFPFRFLSYKIYCLFRFTYL